MPRTHTSPTPLDLRANYAREALADYTAWQVTDSQQDARSSSAGSPPTWN